MTTFPWLATMRFLDGVAPEAAYLAACTSAVLLSTSEVTDSALTVPTTGYDVAEEEPPPLPRIVLFASCCDGET